MSEYQFIEFRAVDRPLTDQELAYAEKQSGRAEISRWNFSTEYHYSSFRGNVDGMLCRGYDIYLEYTNYGTRVIKIRLPQGLPFEKKLVAKYVDRDRLQWTQDSKRKAGILTLAPFIEELGGYWESVDDCFGVLIAIRERLMSGDLRALYLLWLCVAGDNNNDWDEAVEPPVPLGLLDFDLDNEDLFAFFNVDPLLVEAAAADPADNQKSKIKTPIALSPAARLQPWLKSLKAQQAKAHLEALLIGNTAAVKAELLAVIASAEQTQSKSAKSQTGWPTVEFGRTFEVLMKKTETLRNEYDAKEKTKAAAKAKRAAAKKKRK